VTHDELQSLLGAYALDAVEDDEARAVERHLRECPRCRAEVANHRETAALMASVGAEAPAGVWDRISAALNDDPQEDAPAVAPRRRRGRRRSPVRVRVAAALGAAVAAAVAVLSVATVRLDHRVGSLRRPIRASPAAQAATAALIDPLHRDVRLTSADGRLAAQVALRLTGEAYLVDTDLPVLDRGRTYQMWGLAGGRVVSLALLGATPVFAAFRVEDTVTQLMVTSEPAGGVPAPDSPVLIQGLVPVRA
jgi:anti-sigma factor RsiW